MMNINNENDYEPIIVYLTPDRTPIAYQNKVECLKLGGATEEEARKMALEPIELELYYEVGLGLFAIESAAVDGSVIYSPYTKEELKNELDEEEKTKLDVAFHFITKGENIARCALIELVKQNGGKMDIPEHSGGQFALAMLDMGYSTFYFSTLEYNGKTLSFSGVNENDVPIEIDETDLPDNGLCYISDYIVNGIY